MTGAPAERDLPTGTVTYLFTDVVGSTALWQAEPDAMAVALARHDSIIEAIVAEQGGMVVKPRGEGDSRFAVFDMAPAAVSAALAIARALDAEAWPTSRPLRLRTAVHTGTGEVRADDYYGPDVNRAARLRAIGHPGQVLLSGATAHLVRDGLPAGAWLRTLGRHRLRDITGDEEVFQLCHPVLPDDFPPLRAAAAPRHNLPATLSTFIGRADARADLGELIARARLVTVVGTGGAGKTRLALQVASELADEFTEGVWFVELAPLRDETLVADAIASALGITPEPGRELIATIEDQLRAFAALIVLDNCEHVVNAAASAVHRLVAACPEVHVLATSREPLQIVGEVAWPIPPLATPAPGARPAVAELVEFDAVRLFSERARAARPTFALTADNGDAVADLCQRLDGLPLAIELAAARVRALSPAEIVARLDDRFRLLTGGGRTTVERHRTLEAAIDWSYELLSGSEQALMRRLAVFAGGATAAAVEAVTSGGDVRGEEVVDLVAALVDKSLVVAEDGPDVVRYHMLETVRAYALAKLAAAGEEPALRRRHLAFFSDLASEPDLDGSTQGGALDRLDSERDNFRHALAWAEANDGQALLALAASLGRFWEVRGFLTEGRRWLAAGLARPQRVSPSMAAKAQRWAGVLAQRQADYDAARRHYEAGLALSRQLSDPAGTASSLHLLGNIEGLQGDLEQATALYEESLDIGRRLGDQRIVAASLTNLGWLAQTRSDFAAARRFTDSSVAAWRELGDQQGEAQALTSLAYLGLMQGDHDTVRARCAQSLNLQRQLGDRYGEAWSLTYLGWAAQNDGDLATAEALHAEAMEVRQELGDRYGWAWSLSHLGDIARGKGEFERSRALLNESLDIAQELRDTYCLAWSVVRLGRLAAAEKSVTAALDHFRRGLSAAAGHGDRVALAACLEGLAAVLHDRGDVEQAARLFATAIHVRRQSGAPLPAADRTAYDRSVAAVRGALGHERFDALVSGASDTDVRAAVQEFAGGAA